MCLSHYRAGQTASLVRENGAARSHETGFPNEKQRGVAVHGEAEHHFGAYRPAPSLEALAQRIDRIGAALVRVS
jgi:hypothetical protein